jgi:pyruvate, water dikinase
MAKAPHVRWFDSISLKDLAEVGGKNASIGELSALLAADSGRVPDGFALTAMLTGRGLMSRGLARVASPRLRFRPSLI